MEVSCTIDGSFADGDDDVECTFNAADEFQCPQLAFNSTADQTCVATVESFGGCQGTVAGYRLVVTLDGADTKLTLTGDDLM